ncbi:MAG: hypothetical protein M1819_005770 [Sarea resinae]|nr:MAG: hypothetical protein M1819_005770 [Sarea resinae]
MSAVESGKRGDVLFSRRQVEGLIANGHLITILNGKVLKLDNWVQYHPGGDIAVKHMVGRDATDEIQALHSEGALQRMPAFIIGRVEGRWTNFLPPIQGGKFRPYVEGEDLAYESDSGHPSSHEPSPAPSPLFEPADASANLTRRKTGTVYDHGHDAGSMSSISSAEAPPSKPKLSSIDRRTQEEIELDSAKYPPLDPVTQDRIVEKYRILHDRMRTEGLYDCHYSSYFIELCRYTFLFSMFVLFMKWGHYAISGFFLGCFWHQLVFTAHDAGHMGITHNFTADTVIGVLVADFLGGLSLGWWKRNHNVHHIVTNSPEHDPDIEHLPFFAISHRFFDSLRSTYYERIMTYDAFAKFLIRYQDFLYYPILTFGRFNLYRLSWEYLLKGQGPRKGIAWWHRWFEIAGTIFFWTWFGYGVVYKTIPTNWGRFSFVMISHMVTMPVHVQITLSHFAMSTAELGEHESFPQKMLRTTMDVDCPQWLDFFHGGLQFQAIHHLYPRMPRHNLRPAQKLVQQFCNDVDIPYALFGFVDGNKEVIGKLGDIARQAAILAKCQRTIAASEDYGLH